MTTTETSEQPAVPSGVGTPPAPTRARRLRAAVGAIVSELVRSPDDASRGGEAAPGNVAELCRSPNDPPSAPVPPPADEFALLEALREAERVRGHGELAGVGHLRAMLERQRAALAAATRDLADYVTSARERAVRHRFAPDFYIGGDELRAREQAVATARARLADTERRLEVHAPAIDAAEARVVAAREALEAHREAAHPAEREALAAAERAEVDALVAAASARAALVAAELDAKAAEAAFATDGVTWGMVAEARGHVERARVRRDHAEAQRDAARIAVDAATKALALARYRAAAAGADPAAYRAAIREDLSALVRLEAEAAVRWARIEREAERLEYARRRAVELAPAAGTEAEAGVLRSLGPESKVSYLVGRAIYLRRQGATDQPRVNFHPLEKAATGAGDPRDVAELIAEAATAAGREGR